MTPGAGVEGTGTAWLAPAGAWPGGCGGAAGDWGSSATFQAPFIQTHPLPPWTQWPGTQMALRVGGRSQWPATHLHWPFSKSQWPDIQTWAGDGGGPAIWSAAAAG